MSYLAVILAASSVLAAEGGSEDLQSLIQEYRDAKPKVKGDTKAREEAAKSQVTPILKRIGKLGTSEAVAFLATELDSAPPEIGGACAAAIIESGHANSLAIVIPGLAKRRREVSGAILETLASTKKDIAAAEGEIIQLALTTEVAELKPRLPPVLGKFDTPGAAKAILSLVHAKKTSKDDDPEAVALAAFNALKATESEEVKRWLAKNAFDSAGSDLAKLLMVTRLAGELELTGARGELGKLAGHSADKVAVAALAALQRVGLGDTPEDIVAVIDKAKGKGSLPLRVQALDALAAQGTGEALEIVLRYAHGDDPEMRAVAVGSLAIFKDQPKARQALAEALADPDATTRANALQGLARARDKFVIGPLIDFLGKESEQRLRVQAAKLLVQLTGRNMGLVAEDWKKWWEVAGEKFELASEGKKGATGVNAASYFGLEIASERICFVVDISNSMKEMVAFKLGPGAAAGTSVGGEKGTAGGGTSGGGKGGLPAVPVTAGKAMKIDVLKREMVKAIQKLPAEAKMNIITFSADYQPWKPQLQALTSSTRSSAVDFTKAIITSPGTNVFDTLEFALKDKLVDTIYLLSDGEPSAGRIQEVGAIAREIRALNRLRAVTIHSIAFGEESPLLKELAAQNGGEYRFVDKIEEE